MVYGRWMMSQSSETALSSSEALLQQRYSQAKELEKRLFTLLSKRGPLDPHVRDLNNNIRECHEGIILADHKFAESHDVEQAIWYVHYKQIEEFRHGINRNNRIKSMSAAAAPASPAPSIAIAGRKVVLQREPVLAVFKSFLSEASGFYHDLISKLRAKYGLPVDQLSYGGTIAGQDETKAVELKRCQLSCHRCLIFLGDLARYKEFHVESDARSSNLSIAAGYYLKAISVWPSIGHPHNQLAVLAAWVGDELLAVYRYFRSLAVENPFLTARENLIILFEKNRQKYGQLPASAGETAMLLTKPETFKVAEGAKGKGLGDGVVKIVKEDCNQEMMDPKVLSTLVSETRKNFRVRFVRLNGILFTKTSLETFQEVYSAAVCDLEQLLALEDTSLEAGLGSDHRNVMGTGNSGAAGVLQLVSILIFTVQNVNWGSNANHPTYAEVLQRAALFQHAFTASFEIAGRIMRRCAESNDALSSPLLPAMLVLMEWLACMPEMAVGGDADEKQSNARSFFWKQCVALLNRFCGNEQHDDLNGSFEAPFGMGSIDGFGDSGVGVAIWEDYELQGFSPLAPAHLALDFSNRPSGVGIRDKKEKQVRLQRLLAAGKAVVNALEGSGTGILFDEDVGKFYLVGDMLGKEWLESTDFDELSGGPSSERGGSQTDSSISADTTFKNGSLVALSNERKILAKVMPVSQTSGEEEDEELIVFKPVMKEDALQPVLTSNKSVGCSGEFPVCSTAAPEPQMLDPPSSIKDGHATVSATAVSRGGFLSPFGLAPVSNELAELASNLADGHSNVGKGFLCPLSMDSIHSPFAFSTSTLLGMASCSASNSKVAGSNNWCKDVDLRGVAAAYSPLSRPISAQDWLNQTGIPSVGFTNSPVSGSQGNGNMLANGSKKVSNSAGVIGQPKQLRSLPPDVTGNSTNQEIADRGPLHAPNLSNLSSEGLIDVGEYGPVSSFQEVSSFSNGLSSSLASENTSERLQNGMYSSASSGSGTTAPGKSGPAAWLGPSGMRPPPGFGPRPMKLPVNGLEYPQSTQGQLNSQQTDDADERQKLDDYSWLDDYTSSKPKQSHGEKQGVVSSGYSADYCLWSSGIGAGIQSDVGAFPFPGMSASQFRNKSEQQLQQQQKQNLAIQLQQQFLQEQKTKKLSLSLEQQPHFYRLQQSILDGQQQHYSHQQQLLQHQQQELLYRQYCTRDPLVS